MLCFVAISDVMVEESLKNTRDEYLMSFRIDFNASQLDPSKEALNYAMLFQTYNPDDLSGKQIPPITTFNDLFNWL